MSDKTFTLNVSVAPLGRRVVSLLLVARDAADLAELPEPEIQGMVELLAAACTMAAVLKVEQGELATSLANIFPACAEAVDRNPGVFGLDPEAEQP